MKFKFSFYAEVVHSTLLSVDGRDPPEHQEKTIKDKPKKYKRQKKNCTWVWLEANRRFHILWYARLADQVYCVALQYLFTYHVHQSIPYCITQFNNNNTLSISLSHSFTQHESGYVLKLRCELFNDDWVLFIVNDFFLHTAMVSYTDCSMLKYSQPQRQ